jgi:hypothetical protein
MLEGDRREGRRGKEVGYHQVMGSGFVLSSISSPMRI